MSHAQDNVERRYPLVKAACPAVPPLEQIVVLDEPRGDDAPAHALGWHPDLKVWRVSFDEGYEPTDRNVDHELIHLAHANLVHFGGQLDVIDRYVAARWPAATTQQLIDEWFAAGKPWARLVGEMFAETCAAIVDGGHERTVERNVYFTTEVRERMRVFYAGLQVTTAPVVVAPPSPKPATLEPVPAPLIVYEGSPAAYYLAMPVNRGFGVITPGLERFGRHTGVDLGVAEGTPLYALGDGIVLVDDDDSRYDPGAAATWSGVQVTLQLDRDGAAVTIAHMLRNLVGIGDRVVRGQLLGHVGATGAATGPHPHVEIRLVTGELVEPLRYLRELLEEEEMAFTEDDRRMLKAVHAALHDGNGSIVRQILHVVSVILPGYWLQRLYWALPSRVAKMSPWQGPKTPDSPPAYLTTPNPPDGSWADPLLK